MNKVDFRYTQVSEAMNANKLESRFQNKLATGVMALGLALSVASTANAGTFTVTNSNDSGPGSLRQAIFDANTIPGADDIAFSSSVTGSIQITSGPLSVTDTLTITGPGRDQLIIDANNTSRVFQNSSDLSISSLTIHRGGVNSDGKLAIYDSTISGSNDNLLSPGSLEGFGSGIYANNDLQLINSLVKDNIDSHGVLYLNCKQNRAVNFEIKNTQIQKNSGPGVYLFASGVPFGCEPNFSMINSSIEDNGGFGINQINLHSGRASLTIDKSTVSGNSGFGIAFQFYGSVEFELMNSTISGNGIDGLFLSKIYNDTLNSSFKVDNTTITNNNAGFTTNLDLYAETSITNSIVANNLSSDCLAAFNNSDHNIDSNGHNIDSDGTCDFTEAGDQSGVDPLLGPLQFNSASTKTHVLLPGSPAIDAGSLATCLSTDQRGVIRPQGTGCDIGAYEVEDTVSPVSICDIPPVSVGGNCKDEVVVKSMSGLDDYVASNFGKTLDVNGKPVYKNLRFVGHLGEAGVPFDATSPCAITVNANASVTGSDITLHARQGLNVNWSADIQATGEVCLIADKQHALLNGGNLINADTLAIRGAKKSFVGFLSTLNVNEEAELVSTGNGSESQAKVGNKTRIMAGTFNMQADNIAALAYKADIATTGELNINSGNLTTSETLLTNRSSVQAGTDMSINSGGKTSIGYHATVTAGNNLEMNAATEADCSVASITSVTYSSKSGNCSDKLP